MAMSEEKRQEQRFRAFVRHHRDLLMALMKDPKSLTQAQKALKKEKGGRDGI